MGLQCEIIEDYISKRIPLINKIRAEDPLSPLADELSREFSKTLILAIASSFEAEIISHIHELYDVGGLPESAAAFVKNKALARQYHTLFDWKKSNINSFAGLFGHECKDNVSLCLLNNTYARQSIQDFLFIGNERNRMVHNDFINYHLTDVSLDDIIKKYKSADGFVKIVPKIIRGIHF